MTVLYVAPAMKEIHPRTRFVLLGPLPIQDMQILVSGVVFLGGKGSQWQRDNSWGAL